MDITNQSKTGALDIPATEFLKITYPLIESAQDSVPGTLAASFHLLGALTPRPRLAEAGGRCDLSRREIFSPGRNIAANSV